jgi:hypothetical protein
MVEAVAAMPKKVLRFTLITLPEAQSFRSTAKEFLIVQIR